MPTTIMRFAFATLLTLTSLTAFSQEDIDLNNMTPEQEVKVMKFIKKICTEKTSWPPTAENIQLAKERAVVNVLENAIGNSGDRCYFHNFDTFWPRYLKGQFLQVVTNNEDLVRFSHKDETYDVSCAPVIEEDINEKFEAMSFEKAFKSVITNIESHLPTLQLELEKSLTNYLKASVVSATFNPETKCSTIKVHSESTKKDHDFLLCEEITKSTCL